jgi:tricorn protease
VDTDRYDSPSFDMRPSWSADSEWLAYAKQLNNHLHSVFVYSVSATKATELADGLSDASAPAFDKSGNIFSFLPAPISL